MHKARQTQAVLNEIPFQRRQNCVLPSKSGDGKQELVEAFWCFLAWKDEKFQESYNFPGNTKFEKLLLDLLNIKPDCSY